MITYALIMILPYAISTWLVWQGMKQDTILPYGSTTGNYGFKIGWGIKLVYFGILISLVINNGWVYLFSFPITWLLSGWLATLIERKVYMSLVMQTIKELSDYYKNASPDFALKMLSIPEWWFKLMPSNWRLEYASVLKAFK